MARLPFALGLLGVLAAGGGACSDDATGDSGFAGPDCTRGVCQDGGKRRERDADSTDEIDEIEPTRGAADAGHDRLAPNPFPEPIKGDSNLRIVAANLTSGNAQSYGDVGIRLLQGAHPDVALIQEFNFKGNTTSDIREFVDAAFGTSYSVFRETGATIPNGIVSRYPIVASGEWTDVLSSNTRDFAWARIDVPGDVDLWAISVHLLSSSATARASETSALAKLIADNVPSGAYLAVGGDFNTSARAETCIKNLSSLFVVDAPYPQDETGNTNTNVNRNKPYDWVLANAALFGRHVVTQIGEKTFTNGLVLDSRVYQPLADVTPILATDSTAVNMQHMAVLRDFRVE